MRSAGISGLGYYVPKKVITNTDIVAMGIETSNEWIIERTGIEKRHIASESETTSLMGVEAAKMAIANAGLNSQEIDLVIVATTSPDYPGFPSTACLIQHELNMGSAGAFDLAAACSGFVYALSMASAYVQSGQYQHVLVVASDRLSHYVDWSDRSICILFGDGAGAAVVSPVKEGYGIVSSELRADGGQGDILKMQVNKEVNQPCIHMDGRSVFKLAVKHIVPSIQSVLAKAQLKTDDLDWFVPHQANLRIMDFAREKLGIPENKMLQNVQHYGNTSAASIPIALAQASQKKQLKNGDILALIGFGAGFTWASSIIKWSMK